MKNLLDYAKGRTPTEPVRRAAEDLQSTAQEAAVALSDNFASVDKYKQRYFATLGIGTVPEYKLRSAIESLLAAEFGANKGPCQNALAELSEWAGYARQANYPLGDLKVQKRFMHFLLSVATAGFAGEDTTGTQMGNFKGGWRGGGFSDD